MTERAMTLIARLEAATEGSRELDARVWHAVHGEGEEFRIVGPPTYDPPRFFCNPQPSVDWIGYDLLNIAPHYTTSVDAALTLVPEGWGWAMEDGGARSAALVAPSTAGWEGGRNTTGTAPTRHPALALCIAALRARRTP